MPFDSNGVFTRVMNWTSDQQNGIAIECGRHDAEDDNFAEGFNDTFCRDGRAAAIGDFNLGQHKIKNLANGTASTDAVNKGQLDSVNSTLTANSVNLTGTQTISGNKTFSSAVTFANGTWNAVGDDAYMGDMNQPGAVCFKGNNDSTKIMLINRAQTVVLGFYIDENDGNALKLTNPTYGAASWGSVTAMMAKNFNDANQGYIKFNHGLIIQWGTVGTGANFSVTFPTPFSSSASYGIAVAPFYNNGTDAYALNVKNRTNTGFTGYLNVSYNGASYIAIGY